MKILRITAQGLPSLKKDLDICFFTQQRVYEEERVFAVFGRVGNGVLGAI